MNQGTILIVEDEPILRMVLADTLVAEGFDVIEAANVLEAIAALGQQIVDAVITDVDMPGGLNGLDLVRMIAMTRINVRTIVVSGGHILPNEDLPGDSVFIEKPYEMNKVVKMVLSMIEGKPYQIAVS
ncbi:response regulator [Agrobacterium genomosp. 3]|uniref:response regulator n=1 Tax=Agrobacterium tomkonis TaxID=1183410 RepID=UPI001CD8B4FE|nr:response regulator [Agrobacterium tomkonis]MCA1878853.1 response regulator [Agrobacterium tumefaciens]MCA1894065.1 response regulator [Agrobacterium tomkonis]